MGLFRRKSNDDFAKKEAVIDAKYKAIEEAADEATKSVKKVVAVYDKRSITEFIVRSMVGGKRK